MKRNNRCYRVKKISAIFVIAMLVYLLLLKEDIIYASARQTEIDGNNDSKVVVVSLGDSFSSGEGIEPFYGQEKIPADKVRDENWLAHRSEKSWPGQLEFSEIDGTLKDYWTESMNSDVCEWYFVASSGAETKHITKKEQKKEYALFEHVQMGTSDSREEPVAIGEYELSKQIDIFKQINEPIDYVTLTIGGNDVDFVGVIKAAVTGSYMKTSTLKKKLDKLWDNIEITKKDLRNTYIEIAKATENQACIIVAGYPKLLQKDGKGFFSEEVAMLVNDSVSRFNNTIEGIVDEVRATGINIYFVDVEAEFDKDGGHQAYSDESWINGIILGTMPEDLKSYGISSAYSIHPNEEGAKAYARCVNAKIEEIEKHGEISGKVCMASNRSVPIKGAFVDIYKEGMYYDRKITDDNGNYSISVPEGEYQIYIYKTDYVSFKAYATVALDEVTYMETFLMIAGDRFSTGTAMGVIKNALTGNGVGEVKLSVRDGWNNLDKETVLQTVYTDEKGNYIVNLPYGNYTMVAEKDGYISTPVNIIIQRGITSSQNGIITPIARLGGEYRIVLTWELNPRDLDSHMQGKWSNNNSFHVYYSSKSSYGVSNEKCYLDVDDTSSYGPETITFVPAEGEKYYYYVHQYAGSGTLPTSEAKINVYRAGELIATFNVPTNISSGVYWNVFAIDNGRIIPKNTITESPNIYY